MQTFTTIQTNKREQSVEQLVINVFDFLAGRKYLIQYYELWRTQKLHLRCMTMEEKNSRINPLWVKQRCVNTFKFVLPIYLYKTALPNEIVSLIADFCYE